MAHDQYAMFPYSTTPRDDLNDSGDPDPIVAFAMRWWWLLMLGAILGIGGALAYAHYGPTPYQSTALIQIPAQTQGDPTANASQARSATANYAAEASSSRIMQLVAAQLPADANLTADDLMTMARGGDISITASRSANFIDIKVTSEDRAQAQLLANSISSVVVDDINSRASTQLDAQRTALQDQIQFTRDKLAVTQLYINQSDLQSQLRDEQNRLLTLQANYQQELSRRAEADQLTQDSPFSSPTISSTTDELRTEFDTVMTQQIDTTNGNIEKIQGQLDDIQNQIAQQQDDSDPQLSAAFASAYSAELASLTEQFVSQQIETTNATPPLVQYGDASNPVEVQSLKKLAFFGLVAGGALALGLAYGIDFLLKRRSKHQQMQMQGASEMALSPELHALIENLESQGLINDEIDSDVTTAANGPGIESKIRLGRIDSNNGLSSK